MDKLLIAQIDKYFSGNIDIDGRSNWDYYVLNYEHLNEEMVKFTSITIFYHTWVGDKLPYDYVTNSITIPFKTIGNPFENIYYD